MLYNPFLDNVPILYLLKTSDNQRFLGGIEWEHQPEMGLYLEHTMLDGHYPIFKNIKLTDSYFLIPLLIKNNLIYLFITSSQTGLKARFFVIVESHSIFYSSKIVYLQADRFTGYNGIMTEQ